MISVRAIDHTRFEEAERIWYLQHAAYRAEAETIGWKTAPPLMETIRQIQSSGETFVGCECDGELVGAASYRCGGGELTICRMMVHPERFRQGIGSALLTHVLERESASLYCVYAGINNIAALRLYEKFGFAAEKELETMPGVRLVRMILQKQ